MSRCKALTVSLYERESVRPVLPFKNGTRVFENPPMEWFMWNPTVSVGYFLVVTIGLAALAIVLNKSKMTRDE